MLCMALDPAAQVTQAHKSKKYSNGAHGINQRLLEDGCAREPHLTLPEQLGPTAIDRPLLSSKHEFTPYHQARLTVNTNASNHIPCSV